jgi:HPt (histidine-containing phosphotransfer) domain-containing protein
LTPEKDYNPAAMPQSIYPGMEPGDAAERSSNILDAVALLERVNHDIDLLRDLVELFGGQYPELLQCIGEAIQQGSFLELQKQSHKLKGSLLQFSARKAAEIADELEEMGKARKLEGAKEAAAKLQVEVILVARALQMIVDGRSPAHSAGR